MPKFTIRLKTFLGISFALTLLIVCIGISIRHINGKNVSNIEQELNRFNLQQGLFHLNLQQQQLEHLSNHLAQSTTLASFINTPSTMLDLNLVNALNVDNFIIINNESEQVTLPKHHPNKQPNLLAAISLKHPHLITPSTPQLPRQGIITINKQPVLVATRTIKAPTLPQQALGTLILAQQIDQEFWSAANSQGTLTLRLNHDENTMETTQLNSSGIAVNNLYGQPSLYLTSTSEPLIRKQAKKHLLFFLVLLIATGGIVTLITQIILDRLVLSRLHVLSGELKHIGSETQGTITVEGDDEISMISTNIKEMLNRLELGRKRQHQQDQRFADMIEHSGQIVIALGEQGQIALFNHAAEQTTGYKREDVIGSNFAGQFIDNEAAKHLQDYIANAVHKNRFTGNFLLPLRTRDGAVRTISWDAIIERGSNNELTFIGFGRDVTEQHVLEQRLQLINTVFNNTDEAIMISDADNNIVEINPSFARLSGYTEQELIGQNPRILKSNRHDDNFFIEMWQQITGQGHWEGEIWDKKKNGDLYPKKMSIVPIYNADKTIQNFFSVSTNISKQKEDETKLHYLAYFDSLTDLPNRLAFSQHLEKMLDSKTKFSVAILNICNFKRINESIGPIQADLLLQRVAQRLNHCLLEGVYLARMGGDEFGYCVPIAQRDEQREQIIEAIKAPITLESRQLTLDISLGIARAPEHGNTVDDLVKNASIALHSNKTKNLERFTLFHESMNDKVAERLAITEMLREAINRDELEVYYQPKVNVRDGSIVGAEALIRWHSRDGMIPPDQFIPIAEETGMIRPIGEWVLRQACQQASLWRKTNPKFQMAVNISPVQFDQEYLPQLVSETLKQASLPAQALELEITEGMIIDNVDSTVEILHSLQKLGIELSIDDFGTGYSSLSYLTRLPLDILKIDRSFMEKVPDSLDDTNVVRSILALARSLNLRVTAEGVETQQHVDLLRQHECDYIQGYFYSRPLPATEFYHYMSKKQ